MRELLLAFVKHGVPIKCTEAYTLKCNNNMILAIQPLVISNELHSEIAYGNNLVMLTRPV